MARSAGVQADDAIVDKLIKAKDTHQVNNLMSVEMSGAMGRHIHVDLTGIDLVDAKKMALESTHWAKQNRDNTVLQSVVGTSFRRTPGHEHMTNVYGTANRHTGVIFLNTDVFRDGQARRSKAHDDAVGFHNGSPERGAGEILGHELGHMSQFDEEKHNDAVSKSWDLSKFRPAAVRNLKPMKWPEEHSPEQISGYATTNDAEAFAEAYSKATSHGDKSDPATKAHLGKQRMDRLAAGSDGFNAASARLHNSIDARSGQVSRRSAAKAKAAQSGKRSGPSGPARGGRPARQARPARASAARGPARNGAAGMALNAASMADMSKVGGRRPSLRTIVDRMYAEDTSARNTLAENWNLQNQARNHEREAVRQWAYSGESKPPEET